MHHYRLDAAGVIVRGYENDGLPLPTDAIEQPTLRIVDYNGELMDIEPIDGDDNIPLDLPLGVGATTNLQWAYNTSNGSLWAAQFEIGNLLFDGNLNNL